MGRARFLLFPWFIIIFFVLSVTRPKLPLGQIVNVNSNHATDDVYSLQAVKTLMYWTLYEHLLFICCKMHCLFVLLKRLTRNEY